MSEDLYRRHDQDRDYEVVDWKLKLTLKLEVEIQWGKKRFSIAFYVIYSIYLSCLTQSQATYFDVE